MIGSLYSGISGLQANSTSLSVIGDNIANVSTTAYKSTGVSFTNILSESMTGSSTSEVGKGVEVLAVSSSWSQGILESTGNTTDLAINGDGFFVLTNEWDEYFYTRAGEFDFDEHGNLVNYSGLNVQGYVVEGINEDGSLSLGSISDINITGINSAPSATDQITTNLNLDADAAVGDNFSTSVSVYDSLGSSFLITIDFTRTATGWDYTVSWPDDVSADAAVTGSMEFDSTGNLVSPTSNQNITITNLLNGAEDISIDWVFLDESGVSDGSITGYAYSSSTSSVSQNGYGAGTLQSVYVDEAGVVTASFSNGQLTPLYQLVIADFQNYEGLNAVGNSLYEETLTSGEVTFGTAGTGGLGSVEAESLEMSNVDLTEQYVDMITVQAAYEANAKVISTSEEMLDTLINLKR